jgi:Tfp pilus assembly protein PilP
MKLMTRILAIGLMTGGLWAQNPAVINNVKNTMNAVQQKQTDASNAALGTPSAQPTSKPGAGAVAKAPAVVPVSAAVKSSPAPTVTTAKPKAVAPKTKVAAPVVVAAKKPAAKTAAKATAPAKTATATKISAVAKPAEAAKSAEAPKPPKPEEKKWAMSGKRDPFFSPIVQAPSGSGCSTGKKCLEIGQINLRGVVKSENGFIAVVTNSINKAYFLRENDPVFNGYVVRITGDAVVFQETVQDKLGKPSTHEVTKRIVTPAV